MEAEVLPIPDLPDRQPGSPPIVKVLDAVRFALSDDENSSEFYWFAREYPRVYRHHVGHAWYRLEMVHNRYEEFHAELKDQLRRNPKAVSLGQSDPRAWQLYWDFEAFLGAVNSALDILARIVGPAYAEQTPITFNRFRKKAPDHDLTDLFKVAAERWVLRLKDYRDCFVHYTPTDTLLAVTARRYKDGWHLRAPIPSNPNARDILLFKYRRRDEVLRYASTT